MEGSEEDMDCSQEKEGMCISLSHVSVKTSTQQLLSDSLISAVVCGPRIVH